MLYRTLILIPSFCICTVLTSCSLIDSNKSNSLDSSSSGADLPFPFQAFFPETEIWVAPYGNDDNTGTLFKPLQTISAAVDRATPGTAIMIKAGRYYDILVFQNGGIKGKPIWIRSADGNGAAELVPLNAVDATIQIHGAKYIVIEGLRITGEIEVWEGLLPPGSPMGMFGAPAGEIVIQNNIIVSSRYTGIIDVRHSTSVYVLGNDITARGQDAITLTNCLDCVVDGNAVTFP